MRTAILVAITCATTISTTPTTVAATTATWLKSVDGSISLEVGSNGAVTAVTATTHGKSSYSLENGGKTMLAAGVTPAPGSCSQAGVGIALVKIARALGGAGADAPKSVEVSQKWKCLVPKDASSSAATATVIATVVDSFVETNTSIAIQTSITTDTPAVEFTSALRTPLQWDSGGNAEAGWSASTLNTVWMPWGKGCVQNDGRRSGMCFTDGGPWMNPFRPEPLGTNAGYYRYGGMGRGTNDTFSLPMVAVLDPASDAAISLVHLTLCVLCGTAQYCTGFSNNVHAVWYRVEV